MSDKLQELGIPPHEITPSVSIAVSGLLDHVEQLNAQLRQAETQVENLQQMVDADPEGVIPNRRALIKRLEWSIAMNNRYSNSTSIVVFEINNFEALSKTYGYQAAGRLSAHVGKLLSANIRDTDYFARISQNRFGVIMYFASADDVRGKTDRLATLVRQSAFRFNNLTHNPALASGVHLITTADNAEGALLAAINALFVNDSRVKFEEINFKA